MKRKTWARKTKSSKLCWKPNYLVLKWLSKMKKNWKIACCEIIGKVLNNDRPKGYLVREKCFLCKNVTKKTFEFSAQISKSVSWVFAANNFLGQVKTQYLWVWWSKKDFLVKKKKKKKSYLPNCTINCCQQLSTEEVIW